MSIVVERLKKMGIRGTQYTEEQKRQILETVQKAVENGEVAATVIKQCNVGVPTYYGWKKKADAGESLAPKKGGPKKSGPKKSKKKAKPKRVKSQSLEKRVVYTKENMPSGADAKGDIASELVKENLLLRNTLEKNTMLRDTLGTENKILRDILVDRDLELYALKRQIAE